MKKEIIVSLAIAVFGLSPLVETQAEPTMNQFEVRTMPYAQLEGNEAIPVKFLQFDIEGEQVNVLTDLAHEIYIVEDDLENEKNYIIFMESGNIEMIKEGFYQFSYESDFADNVQLSTVREKVKLMLDL